MVGFLLVLAFFASLAGFMATVQAVSPRLPLPFLYQEYYGSEEEGAFYPGHLSYRRAEDTEKALQQVCRQVWIEGRRAGCPEADSPDFAWAFLLKYGAEGEIGRAADLCTPSSVLDCAHPERYGCYLLKRLVQPFDRNYRYDLTGVSGYPTTDPCAFAEIIK
jgi:hypothetical protein